jgi:hypothetical protein
MADWIDDAFENADRRAKQAEELAQAGTRERAPSAQLAERVRPTMSMRAQRRAKACEKVKPRRKGAATRRQFCAFRIPIRGR